MGGLKAVAGFGASLGEQDQAAVVDVAVAGRGACTGEEMNWNCAAAVGPHDDRSCLPGDKAQYQHRQRTQEAAPGLDART